MASNFTKRMTLLAGRIFVDVGRVDCERNLKLVKIMSEKPMPIIKKDYYPPLEELHHVMVKLRYLGLYRDEHADFTDAMNRLRELRGKGKRRKGEGKRASLR